ncbi:MAG: orotidine-5'-phosphate decarboxylase [Caldilineaceae bacterium]
MSRSTTRTSSEFFYEKLAARIGAIDSLLCVGLDPNPAQLPARFADLGITFAEQLLAWNSSIIEETADYAAAFKPNIAFFEAQGPDGYDLLRATLDAIPPDIPVILDAKRGDIGNSSSAYARAIFDQLGVDAVTLNPYLGQDSLQPFLDHEDKGCFLLCRTSNAGSADFQELEISDWRTLDREANQPLYIRVARTVTGWANNIGLVVGATYPESLAAVRTVAPDAWILVPGVGAQGGAIEETLEAGLRGDGLGLLLNVSRGISLAEDPGMAARQYSEQLRPGRQRPVHAAHSVGATDDGRAEYAEAIGAETIQTEASSTSGAETVRPAQDDRDRQQHLDELAANLVQLGAIQFGEFTLASGITSPFYIDLRLLVGDPSVLASAAERYAMILDHLTVERIAGVPYAALPIGTAVSLRSGRPMIYPRKEVKDYGLQRGIEGVWNPGEHVVIIEDLVTSGGSTLRSVERLREAGLIVEDAIVLIDREQGGVENLAKHGVAVHSVMTLSYLLDSLERQGVVAPEQIATVREFVRESQIK